MKNRIITASEIGTWKTCRKRWWFSYDQCLEPLVPAKPLSYGSAVHEILAKFYSHEFPGTKEFLAYQEGVWGDEVDFIAEEISCLIDAYINIGPFYDHEIVGIEKEFKVKVPSPKQYHYERLQFAGKIDLEIKDQHGNLWLVDHKTSKGTLDSQWLELADQMKYYLWAKIQQGHSPVGIIYNLIRKPSIKPHKNDTPEIWAKRLTEDIKSRPEFYFQREPIVKTDQDIEQIGVELWQLAHEVGKGMIYRNPGSCQLWNNCPYRDLCIRDTKVMRSAGFRISERHRELKEVTK